MHDSTMVIPPVVFRRNVPRVTGEYTVAITEDMKSVFRFDHSLNVLTMVVKAI